MITRLKNQHSFGSLLEHQRIPSYKLVDVTALSQLGGLQRIRQFWSCQQFHAMQNDGHEARQRLQHPRQRHPTVKPKSPRDAVREMLQDRRPIGMEDGSIRALEIVSASSSVYACVAS